MPVRTALVIASAIALLGCYRSHARRSSRDDGGGRDGGARDASMRDAGRGDVEELPLPDEPPSDPGPDARPSDDGDGWRDPPAPADPDPCCRPVTGTTEIPLGEEAGGDVAITFTGEGWAVMYVTLERSLFQELARDGRPIGPLRRHEPRALGVTLAYRGSRVAALITRQGSGEQDSVLGLLDRHGVLAAGWTELEDVERGGSIAYLEHLDRFLVGTTGPRIDGFDRGARHVGRAALDGWPGSERPTLVGMKSRAVMFQQAVPDVYVTTISSALVPEPWQVAYTSPTPDVGDDGELLRATRLRDEAIAVVAEPSGSILVAVDPFEDRIETLPTVPLRVGDLRDETLGLDEPGLIAICATPGPDMGGTTLHVIGRDGQPRGGPIVVDDRVELRSACALGWDGDTLFVAWTAYFDHVIRVRGYAVE